MFQDELERHQIINSFLETNNLGKLYKSVEFYAIVGYVELAIYDVTKVRVALDGYNYGSVEVYPTTSIDANIIHTGFLAQYHEYQLKNKTLVIMGTASPDKSGKDYTVHIKPISKADMERILRIG